MDPVASGCNHQDDDEQYLGKMHCRAYYIHATVARRISPARHRQQRLPSSWELSKKGTMREDERKGDVELWRGKEAETNRILFSNPQNVVDFQKQYYRLE